MFDLDTAISTIVNKYFEKMEFKIFGGVALFRVCPLRGLPSPIWPLLILVIGTLTKIVFVRGWLPPIWGRYGVWPVCSLVHFFSKFLPEILEILSWSIVPTAYYRFWDFKENLIPCNSNKFRSNFGKVTFWGAKGENIQSRGRYNGLMLKFSFGGAVTVRDRPHKVYEVE